MTDEVSKERRSFVRGDFSFKVKYRIMTREEYKTMKGSDNQLLPPDGALGLDIIDSDRVGQESPSNAYMTDFLLQMDEKLDKILALLSNGEPDKGLLSQGLGVNISGAGISMRADKPVESGTIVQTNFVLSKNPMVFIKVFGEVERITPVKEEGVTRYEIGIRFLDISPEDRERIITFVFQRQRKAIRNRKSERYDGKDG